MRTKLPQRTSMRKGRRGVRTRRPLRKVGFYGCNDRVVRVVTLQPQVHYPLKVRLECPACSHEHDAQPMWRPWVEVLDEGKEAVVCD